MENDRKSSRGGIEAPVRWIGLVVRGVLGTPARAVRGTAGVVGDPARQVRDYFVSERVTVRQGIVAVSIAALTSLVAGVVLAAMDRRLEEVAGLLLLVPVSIGLRGAIFGALAARLGTSIHSGLFEVSREREGVLYQNVYAAALLTVATSVTMAVLARAIAALLDIDTVSVWDFIAVALVGGILSSAVVLAVTVLLSVVSFRRDWDLDSVGAPLITAIGDVVTLPMLFVASFLVDITILTPLIGVVGVVSAGLALARGWSTARLLTRGIVRESFPILSMAIVLAVLAGAVVEPRTESIFIPFPALLIVLPSFLENTGALGSILAARLGSKLHLGAVTPTAKPEAAALLDGTIVLALGLTVYTLTAASALGLAAVLDAAYPGVVRFVGSVLVGGMLATLVAAVIGYYAAIVTYRFGFDPDNHTIPLVTSGMDLLGVISLVIGLTLFGVT